jgi:hypothetical protein
MSLYYMILNRSYAGIESITPGFGAGAPEVVFLEACFLRSKSPCPSVRTLEIPVEPLKTGNRGFQPHVLDSSWFHSNSLIFRIADGSGDADLRDLSPGVV